MADDIARVPLRTAVVTGAGSGIGRAVARQLLDAGFAVALAGRTAIALEEAADRHRHAACIPTDVTDPAAVDKLFTTVQETWGRLDVLFNNAGIFGPTAPLDEIDPEAWNQTVAVNLTGSMLCAAAAFRIMKNQSPRGGRIINNGSVSAQVPRPHSAAYAATKHGVSGLTKSIDLDGRPYGITAGQIDIGNAATAIIDGAGIATGALQPDGRRLAEPSFNVEEAARAVVLMATLPPSATVNHLTITATGMPYTGRG